MAKSGQGRIISQGRARTRFISVPAEVAGDDRFPFETGETLIITIAGERLTIEKAQN